MGILPFSRYTAIWKCHGFKTTNIFHYTVPAVCAVFHVSSKTERVGIPQTECSVETDPSSSCWCERAVSHVCVGWPGYTSHSAFLSVSCTAFKSILNRRWARTDELDTCAVPRGARLSSSPLDDKNNVMPTVRGWAKYTLAFTQSATGRFLPYCNSLFWTCTNFVAMQLFSKMSFMWKYEIC